LLGCSHVTALRVGKAAPIASARNPQKNTELNKKLGLIAGSCLGKSRIYACVVIIKPSLHLNINSPVGLFVIVRIT